MNRRVGCLTVLVLLVAMPAWAYDGIVEKKTFAMPAYATVGGTTIKGVRVGYETYGTLNAARDNVILVAHFYSGNSHAAGKYAASDPAPGYWDAIIGSGKPVDTDRFFVVSSDTLVNLNVKDPRSEEHTSELQSRPHLVCRLLLEKKKRRIQTRRRTSRVVLNTGRNLP